MVLVSIPKVWSALVQIDQLFLFGYLLEFSGGFICKMNWFDTKTLEMQHKVAAVLRRIPAYRKVFGEHAP